MKTNVINSFKVMFLCIILSFSSVVITPAYACLNAVIVPPPWQLKIINGKLFWNVGGGQLIPLVFNVRETGTAVAAPTNWVTHGSTDSDYCACGLRLPTNVVDSVAAISIQENSDGTVVPGFNFVPDGATSASIEALSPAGAGSSWFGFSSDQTANITSGLDVGMSIEIVLKPGKTDHDLFDAINNDSGNRFYTDEALPSGAIAGTHGGFSASGTGIGISFAPLLGLLGQISFVVGLCLVSRSFIKRRKL